MLRFLYQIVVLIVSPLVGLVFLLHVRGRAYWSERFGLGATLKFTKSYIWFHGASLGEVQALVPLAESIKERFPQYLILLTSTSSSGRDVTLFPADERRLLPFDSWLFYICFFRSSKCPSLLLFGETELWPGLLSFTDKNGIPSVLVNGVLSDTVFRRYMRSKFLFSPALAHIKHIFSSSHITTQRFIELGAELGTVVTTGNTKYDRKLISGSIEHSPFFLEERKKIIFASVHPDDWKYLRQVLSAITNDYPTYHFIIAPRHLSKISWFEEKLKEDNILYSLRSLGSTACNVVLLDTLGELTNAFPDAEIAFLGGTFCNVGGHNPFEATVHGVPLFVGKCTHKINSEMAALRSADAVIEITDYELLIPTVLELLANPDERERLAAEAKKVAESFAGATERILHWIETKSVL